MIISNLKWIWAHRPSINGTNPLLIVLNAIIIFVSEEWIHFCKYIFRFASNAETKHARMSGHFFVYYCDLDLARIHVCKWIKISKLHPTPNLLWLCGSEWLWQCQSARKIRFGRSHCWQAHMGPPPPNKDPRRDNLVLSCSQYPAMERLWRFSKSFWESVVILFPVYYVRVFGPVWHFRRDC